MKIDLLFRHHIKKRIWTLIKLKGSQGYGGEYFGANCEGCGVAVGSGKTGQEIYNDNFYGGIFRD